MATVIEYLYLATCAECGCHKLKMLSWEPVRLLLTRILSSIFRWLTVAWGVTGFLHRVGNSQMCCRVRRGPSRRRSLKESVAGLLTGCFRGRPKAAAGKPLPPVSGRVSWNFPGVSS